MYHVNIKRLVPQSKRIELSLYLKNLIEEKSDVTNLLKWATLASADDKCLLTPELKSQKSSNIDKLARFYSYSLACFPNPDFLSQFPETFEMLRMSLLRTQMLIRDTVVTFSILQFTIGLSKDERRANRIKTALFTILADEHRQTADSTIGKIINVISIERPGMTDSERQLLHGLIGRIMSKGCPQEQVPKLALQRIQLAIQRRLFHVTDDSGRMLEHFDGEVKRIVDQAENIWKLSVGIYKPVYETLINFSRVWQ
jgi:T-complex protein 11